MRVSPPRIVVLLCVITAISLLVCAPAFGFASTPSGFGFEKFDGSSLSLEKLDGFFVGRGGELDMQAGSHPGELNFSFALDTTEEHGEKLSVGGELRDLKLSLPAGLIVNAQAVSRCALQALDEGRCASISQVGEVTLQSASGGEETSPIYNMVPPETVPAMLAFRAGGQDVLAYMSLRTGAPSPGEGGIDLDFLNLPPRGIVGGRITLFGVAGFEEEREVPTPHFKVFQPTATFLTLPTVCGEPISFAVSADTWQDEGAFARASFRSHETPAEGGAPVGVQGCDRSDFAPTVSVSTETREADTASGLTIDVKSPPEGLLAPAGVAPADIQDATVTLPEGLVMNPNRAEALLSCPASEDGLTTEAEKAEGKEDDGPPSCSGTSQLGTVQIATPILPGALEGGVYALPSSPPELRLLLSGSADGVNLKLQGVIALNEATGQVTLSFPQAPLLPISELRVSLSGGAQAALVTPRACGSYAVSSDLTPWTTPAVLDALETNTIEIASGPEGGACAFPPPFTPALTAGTSNDGAGGFASLSLLLARPDGQQRVSSLQFTAPAGLSAMLSSVPLCEEPQAAQGACPAASEVGQATLGAGPGGYPLFFPGPGQPPIPVYLTGSYEGAPYGLAIVVPFIAGPYDLGRRVIRARIEVNPHTAQLTIATDPLPSILHGVPLDLRTLYATLDRPGFVFNPTGCTASSFQGSASSVEGATAPISTSFQVGACQSLKFTPMLEFSTSAKTSASQGASLTAKIAYPPSREGTVLASSQANLQSVKLQLPKQLPARLATLARACTEALFNADPAGCPAASIVGQASAVTPMLSSRLSGPAYLVSHSGEPYPRVIVVLQGGGLKLDLAATLTIAKTKLTTVTFTALPDIPLDSLALTLPESPYSALAADVPATAKNSLCGQSLKAPTTLTGQNGAVITQTAKISVTGCPKVKKRSLTRAQRLKAALKACRKKHREPKRLACEKQAHRRYGPIKKKK